MTVSPQRPQDGNHQPSVGGNGVRSDNGLDSQTMPPTLFKLPNLDPEARGPAQTDHLYGSQAPADQLTSHPIVPASQQSDSLPGPDEPPATAQPATTHPATTHPATTSPAAADTSSAAAASTTSDINSREREPSRFPEPHPAPRDVPLGRSWMDRIGSHSVVVVLLLVVVAAGLVVGRNSRNQGIDSSFADSNDLLDFDEGTELELPLAKHDYEPPVAIAEVKPTEAASSAPTQGLKASDLEPGGGGVTDTIAATDAPTGSAAAEVEIKGPEVAEDAFGDSAAFLNHPHADIASTGDSNVDRVEVNEVMDESTGVGFVPVSNRVPADAGITLPTLNDLDDQSEGLGGLTLPDEKTPSSRLSRTPNPVIDWRLYLPAVQPTSADTDVPLTSN